MIKHKIIKFLLLFVIILGIPSSVYSEVVRKGSFIKGSLLQTVSSEFNNKQDAVKFLVTEDFYIENKTIIPKNSVFVGYVNDLGKAEQGRDGYFSVNFYGIILPTGENIPIKAHLWAGSSTNIFGGKLTRRSSYKTIMHRSECFGRRGIMQMKQYGPRILGSETKLKAGTEMIIELDENVEF